MLSVAQALETILAQSRPLEPRRVGLDVALGCRLAEPVRADLDLPPFDKALMDGYAVRSTECAEEGPRRFSIGEEITAGRTPSRPLAPGEAAVIMTGAPLPEGADAVVMHEKTTVDGDGFVTIPCPVRPGEARLPKGREMVKGQVLFETGEQLNAIKLGVLAAVGKSEILVTPRPRVVILPTGDELVAIDATPGPGQIRETNSTVLAGLVRTHGADAIVRPVARDEPEALRQAILDALTDRPDILLICGGVSAGKRDLVPDVLASIGVTTLFHKVRLRPGKPLLFGTIESVPSVEKATEARQFVGPGALVFGLPGNPVSGIVGFLLFVEPALRVLHDVEDRRRKPRPVTLDTDFRHRGDRPTYHPARISQEDPLRASPMPWAGSSDLYTVSRADGFLRFDAGDRDYQAGEIVDFLPLTSSRL